MATKKKLLQAAAGQAGGEALNVEDVFSCFLYTGTYYNEDGDKVTVNNNIDLSGEGGLVWLKSRENTRRHMFFDTERGASVSLSSNNTAGNNTGDPLDSFTSTGFITGDNYETNEQDIDFVSWTFRKAPKFFTCLTYTGDGVAGRTVSHNLGSVPGCIIIKRTDSASAWPVYHRGMDSTAPEDYAMYLNATGARTDSTVFWNDTAPTSTDFTVSNNNLTNGNGFTYVAYLFAHNDGDGDFGPDGDADIIKCGSYTGNGSSTGPEIDLGFEPQWIMTKNISDAGGWHMFDNMRGITTGENDPVLYSNLTNAEDSGNNYLKLTSTGFQLESSSPVVNDTNKTYIYIAIRRGQMATPEDAADVFDIATRDATEPHFNSNFDTVDFALYRSNISGTADWFAATRLMSPQILRANTTGGEVNGGTGFVMDFSGGWYGNSSANSSSYSWMWKRAHGYFDTVAYKGSGTARTIGHNLGVVPEMIWVKIRSTSGEWSVYHKDVGNDKRLQLNDTVAAQGPNSYWNNTTPTDSVFSIGTANSLNKLNHQFMAYLFASVDGVSKVGSYTGTGSSQTIDCGFSSGARFVLIKRTDTAYSWYLFDTERGIVAGADPFLRLDETDAEVGTDDIIDPDSSGFTLPYGNPKVNASGGTYIFYAIA